jgi:hypothetical protein
MAWTLPKTWASVLVTVADLQQQISDNLSSGPVATSASNPATQLATQLTPANGARAMHEAVSGQGVPLVYSNGHWVSEPVVLISNLNASSNSTSYQTLGTAICPLGFKVWSGSNIQFRLSGWVGSSGTETTTIAISAFQVQTPEPTAGNEFGAVTSGASAGTIGFQDTGWVAPSTIQGSLGTPFTLGAWIRLKVSATSGTKTQSHLQLETRLFF